ncbi:hypothetical protein L596_001394 [Steinernema carpocapsae]|uniref:SUN domain-containing protein n=1 Tax=Steinernema carpocapsae TaxID=34508 RepID=A0A4U8ULB6_STECR|nr:hypothetical protein L596_001394 [Steinernema carpocapsae]
MINREIDEAIEDILRRLRFGIVVLLTVLVLTSITLNEVRRRDELRRHMNYASLTHGALIVDHTATMSELDGVKALTKNSPEIVIRVNKNLILPGSCWPFVGGKGFLTIELAETIIATGFIYEHLPLTFIPHPVTAPHVFNMTGYKSAAALEADDGCALGQATFDPTATQKETIAHRFPNGTCGPIRFIRFEILDNLGGTTLASTASTSLVTPLTGTSLTSAKRLSSISTVTSCRA